MTKANKRSLDAKAYINGKVNDMREQFHKAPDEEARKQLVKNFRETTSSEEYQENLKIVHEDTNKIRKGLKPRERTPENFDAAKHDFYGTLNMYLSDKDLDELNGKDPYEKIKFLFKKLGDGDKTLLSILYLSDRGKSNYSNEVLRNGEQLNYRIPEYGDWMMNIGCDNKFHNLGVETAKKLLSRSPFDCILLLDPDAFLDNVRKDSTVIDYIKWTITTNRLGGNGLRYGHTYDTRRTKLDIIFDKIGDEKIKEIINNMGNDSFIWFLGSLTFYVGIEKFSKFLDYSFDVLTNRIKDERFNQRILERLLYIISSRNEYKGYQKQVANACVEGGHINVLNHYINKFIGLKDEEKSEILGRDIVKEKFDRDLLKLQELGAKLGKQIVVKDVEYKNSQEPEKKKRRWPRNK